MIKFFALSILCVVACTPSQKPSISSAAQNVDRVNTNESAKIPIGSRTENLVIIGSGNAGLTAAIYAARALLAPVVIAGQPGGQLATTDLVENFPGFPEGIKGRDLMDRTQKQAELYGTRFVVGLVTKIEKTAASEFSLTTDSGITLKTKSIIIATGASPRWLDLPKIRNTQGISACAVCDGNFYRNQEVGVVGGGDVAAEEANYLSRIANKVNLYVRTAALSASQISQQRLMANPKISIKYNSEVVALVVDANASLTAITVKDANGQHDEAVSGLFMGIGMSPNTTFLNGFVELKDGFIATQGNSTATNVPGVFAAGDVEYGQMRQGVIAAGRGADAALRAEKYLDQQ